MKKIFILLFLGVVFVSNAQKKTCNKEEESLEDLNSLTKCSLTKGSKNTGQIRVRVSAKRNLSQNPKLKKRFLKSLKIRKNLSSSELKKAKKFSVVDEIPTFKKCTAYKGEDRLDCFNEEMVKHIEEHFNYPNEAVMKKIEGEVWVRFVIGKDGYISNIKAYTKGTKKHKVLEEEAIKVVSYLPVLAPGIKNGKPVSVKYGFPINFELN